MYLYTHKSTHYMQTNCICVCECIANVSLFGFIDLSLSLLSHHLSIFSAVGAVEIRENRFYYHYYYSHAHSHSSGIIYIVLYLKQENFNRNESNGQSVEQCIHQTSHCSLAHFNHLHIFSHFLPHSIASCAIKHTMAMEQYNNIHTHYCRQDTLRVKMRER